MSGTSQPSVGRHRAADVGFGFGSPMVSRAEPVGPAQPTEGVVGAWGIAAVAVAVLLALACIAPGLAAVVLLLAAVVGLPVLLLWARSRPEAVRDRAERHRSALEAQRPVIERNYRMEVQLGWRPDVGYDLRTEAARFTEAGAFNGVPRPAIWSYSDALGGVPLRTPGGAVGPMNRRYGPWTPWQWAGAAAGAWAVLHHRR